MGLKIFSQQFRDSILKLNLATPPDIVTGLSDLVGGNTYQSYHDAIGKDAVIKNDNGSVAVKDAGNITDASVAPRKANLNKNITTPQDVFLGIKDTTPSQAVAQQYLSGRGAETVLHDLSVTNPGSIDDWSAVELKKLFGKNIIRNQNDPSQSDEYVMGQGYTYTTLISGIGQPATINDYNVLNLSSVSMSSNITPEVQLNLALQQNKYMPTQPNQFEVVVNLLESNREPYVNLNTGMFLRYQPQDYQPSEFIGTKGEQNPLGLLSSNTRDLLKMDTVLMNIAALELKFNFENRIKNAIERETIGKSFIDEALTNPITAINVLRDPLHNLFERNWEITVGPDIISKSALTAARIAGLEIPVSIIPEEKILMPGNFSNVVRHEWDYNLLKYTGGGQKFALQTNMSFNKYTPIFSVKRNAGQYIGRNDLNPLELSNPQKLSQDYEGNFDIELSEHGKIATNFAWIGAKTTSISNVEEISSYSRYRSLFRTGSIMDVTQGIVNKYDDGTDVSKTAIDQTKRKLDDGYKILSKGSAVLGGLMVSALTTKGSKNTYNVPNRKDKGTLKDAEFCRVWTKEKPYGKINSAIRYKELIRKERNSVIDANGNYNIFPTQINVNEGYGRPGTGMGDATVEAFGERRARKYMFSIENLAWRDSKQFIDLPACEKGSNGGRIMWFPPYDIKFTDDNTANWTTHSFLGRPEPIYTYNNTERSGTLSFKIVVDHPSILNTLVKYELSKLNDNDVDEVLASFWSGCLEYDVYELARIWGVLSDQDINYFKDVLADLNPTSTNTENQVKTDNKLKTQPVKENSKPQPISKVNNYSLFFENDVPFPENAWSDSNYTNIASLFNSSAEEKEFFRIKSFDEYFLKYQTLATSGSAPVSEILVGGKLDTTKTFSAAAYKSKIYHKVDNRPKYEKQAAFSDYSLSIGNRVSAERDNYFFGNLIGVPPKFNGFTKQKEQIELDIKDSKYDGYDLNIDLTAFSSPLTKSDYNSQLADRRFKSVVIWIATVVLKDKNPTFLNDIKITKENVYDLFVGHADKIEFKKNGKERVVLNKKIYGEKLKTDLIKEFSPAYIKNGSFTELYNGKTYTCYTQSGVKTIGDYEGRLEPPDEGSGVERKDGDFVCGDLSIVASRARRVDIKISATQILTTEPETSTDPGKKYVAANKSSVTKREIAQRLLNKLVTECDYFEYMKDNSPVAYNTLKEKLKFFQPAFHAITPEGLNSRLTFLQQCLRPGETIAPKGGGCDAVNTSFGKPPICVLRIGDLYNTKIVINNLNISYDPLVWDLNPEGIGAQPMLADVNISFKYIGGSGLRKYVDQLQNALSFNYYANTDMYDERTFANTDAFERNLINLEEDFFQNDTSDLQKIVDLINITPELPEDSNQQQSTLIGTIVETPAPHLAGGPYYLSTGAWAVEFEEDVVYAANSLVSYSDVLYQRTEKYPDSSAAPDDFEGGGYDIWESFKLENYGEEAYLKEYGRNYITLYKVDYKDAFKNLYQSYLETIGNYVGLYESFTPLTVSPVMLNFLMKQKYGQNYETGTTTSEEISSGFTIGTSGSPKTADEVFKIEAAERNYKNYHEIGDIKVTEDEIMKLHLYPQDKFYKMTNEGTSIAYPTNKVNPGAFKGIYLKDKSTIFDDKHTKIYFTHHVNTLTQKIEHDMVKFINQNESVFNSYMRDFYEFDRDQFKEFLNAKLSVYANDVSSNFESTSLIVRQFGDKITQTTTALHKLSLVLNGSDGLGEKMYLEVVPNGATIDDISSVFGLNPYQKYKTIKIGETESNNIDLSTVKSIISNRYSAPETTFNTFLSLGNGYYFFKQVTNSDSVFNGVATSPYFDATNLPYYKNLNNGVEIGSGLNNVDYRDGHGLTIRNTITDTDEYTGAYEPNAKMKTTFEKINYEMLDFSNKTLSVMLNDTVADTSTTVDTTIKSTGELKSQLQTLLTGNSSAEDIITSVIGKNELHPFVFIEAGDLTSELESINDKITFKFKFTAEWVNNHNNWSSNAEFPTNLINSTIDVNYYDEILLLGFYQKLLADGPEALVAEFKHALNVDVVTPKKGLNNRQQKDYVKQMTEKRTKIAEDLVKELVKFVDEISEDLMPLDESNLKKISVISKNIRKILFNENSDRSLYGEDYSVLAEKMLTANKNDYILLMRQTTSADERTKSLLKKLYY